MVINHLNFNENKIEVTLFRFSGTSSSPCIDLSSLAPNEKSIITNLGVKMDPSLKLKAYVNTVAKACFFQLR